MGRSGQQLPALKAVADAHDGASFPACHSLVTNGTSDSSDIDNPSPDAKTVEKQGARHKSEQSCFFTAQKKLCYR